MLAFLWTCLFGPAWRDSSVPCVPESRYLSPSRRFRDDRRMRRKIQDHGARASSVLPQVDVEADFNVALPSTNLLPDPVPSENFGCTVPLDVTGLIASFLDNVWTGDSTFSEYCKCWVQSEGRACQTQRSRDIFPLPLLTLLLSGADLPCDRDLYLRMCNVSALGLNFMWDGCVPVPPRPRFTRPNGAQQRVHAHIEASVRRMFTRLTDVRARIRSDADSSAHPNLKASQVDMGPVACTCDAQSYLSSGLLASICDDGGLFRDVSKHRAAVPRSRGCDKEEYSLVTARGLKTGKLRLRLTVKAGGSVFAVAKPNGGQREVWHGRYVSSIAPEPPQPRHQPTPAALLDLEAGPGQPLYFSKRDATSYFDSLAAPLEMRKWFGRPGVKALDLVHALGSSSLEDLREFIDWDGDQTLNESTTVYPVACCWPMGFSWSSAVGQDVMLAQAEATGLTAEHLLADDKPAPNADLVNEFHAICTDDLMHWARDPSLSEQRMAALDKQWSSSGLIRRADKDTDWKLHGTALGCNFDG